MANLYCKDLFLYKKRENTYMACAKQPKTLPLFDLIACSMIKYTSEKNVHSIPL